MNLVVSVFEEKKYVDGWIAGHARLIADSWRFFICILAKIPENICKMSIKGDELGLNECSNEEAECVLVCI